MWLCCMWPFVPPTFVNCIIVYPTHLLCVYPLSCVYPTTPIIIMWPDHTHYDHVTWPHPLWPCDWPHPLIVMQPAHTQSLSPDLNKTWGYAYFLCSHPSQHFCGNPEHTSETPNFYHSEFIKMNSFDKAGAKQAQVLQDDKGRLKRQTSSVCTQPNCVCPMHLVATHLFHQRYARTNNVDDTILFMVSS